jgi:NAD-dependent DNA ligase
MAGTKVTNILKSKSNLSEEEIAFMTDAEGWKWIYKHYPSKKDPEKNKPQICFTGFRPAEKEQLFEYAKNKGMKIVKSVTKKLSFLCIGENAGPSKIRKATEQNVIILDDKQFVKMLETGELPDK